MSDILPVLLCMILFQDGFAVTVEHLVHFQHGISVGQCIENDALLGTAIYAAPEQFGLSRSDARTDIYAMGILMNELLTGLHPAVTRYEAGPLKDVITRCTQMNPADRYQTMEALAHALKEEAEKKTTSVKKFPGWKWAAAELRQQSGDHQAV